ncbi:hypothetical protein L1987_37833 [Smallanthus sonchifolius]|uniref:Uncharacterized protein n=1 Tax=Smallanthus sonchifolius TaxID=185202 RepID=A0ACB9HHG6_9ASTR|nr:hypothetical protein L1987_37833 [Smallanthus sonchifolius]
MIAHNRIQRLAHLALGHKAQIAHMNALLTKVPDRIKILEMHKLTRNDGELIANGRKEFRRRRAWFPASSATNPVASSGSVASGRIVRVFAWENCKQFGGFDGLVDDFVDY